MKRQLPQPAYTARGSRASLLRRTSAEEDETAREELRGLMFAESSKKPRESRRRTVCLVIGIDFEKEGLSRLTMETAAARFRSAGYRSGFHYLLEAKRMPVEHGHAWTEQLEQSLRDCRRALERGIGPPKRAGELRVSQIAQVEDYLDDEHEEGPRWPKRAWLIATFWVLQRAHQRRRAAYGWPCYPEVADV